MLEVLDVFEVLDDSLLDELVLLVLLALLELLELLDELPGLRASVL